MKRAGDQYQFSNLRPHPEAPISMESYDELDSLIAHINSELGIGGREFCYAHSPAGANRPGVDVSRGEIPDGSTLGVTFINGREKENIDGRNDAGTRKNPHQAAANKTTWELNGKLWMPVEIDLSVSAPEFDELIGAVKERADAGSFEVVTTTPLILGAVAVSSASRQPELQAA